MSYLDDDHGKVTDPPEVGTAVQKWADSAMFTAEPIDAESGPEVYLLSMTPDPLGAIAGACKIYKGEVVRDLSTVTDDQRREYLEQVQKTKLQAPFEFVKFHFLIEGVTRAFTHQMVRQRTAVYAQESLRFAVKEDMPVGLPPSLSGSRDFSEIQVDVDLGDFDRLSDVDKKRWYWERTTFAIGDAYESLVNAGMPAEDARGLLPHNTLTRLHYCTDLRALLDHAGNRLCTQAQFEWRLVFAKIAEAIRAASKPSTAPRQTTHFGNDTPNNSIQRIPIHMADKIADLFRPVCYQTGKCEFKANFDRACSIRERVDANAAVGRPSSEWHKDSHFKESTQQEYTREGERIISAIQPAEWLLDPGAAR